MRGSTCSLKAWMLAAAVAFAACAAPDRAAAPGPRPIDPPPAPPPPGELFTIQCEPVDAALEPRLRADVAGAVNEIERFFGAPFPHAFDVVVDPDRTSFGKAFSIWDPDDTECWMVASGVADRLRLLSPLEQLDRMTRHDRGDCVLVDQLRMAIAAQQHAEIIEPRHNPLQLHPVHQKDGQRGFAFSHVVEEGVL